MLLRCELGQNQQWRVRLGAASHLKADVGHETRWHKAGHAHPEPLTDRTLDTLACIRLVLNPLPSVEAMAGSGA